MQQPKPSQRSSRPIQPFAGRIFGIPISHLDQGLLYLFLGFLLLVIIQSIVKINGIQWVILLRDIHFHISRFSLVVGLGMLVIAVYIGIIRHGDVTDYFRRGTYVMVGVMILESFIGAILYFGIGTRPADEVHLLYGLGTVLALPFFIYVERTATKRPAMGSYIWGFTLLAAIIVRCIGTGAIG